MEYYSVLKRKDTLTQATVWVDAGDVLLSEQAGHRQTHTPLVRGTSRSQSPRDRERAGEGRDRGLGRCYLLGTESRSGEEERALEVVVVTAARANVRTTTEPSTSSG